MRSAGTDRVSWDGSNQPVRGQPGRIESSGTDRVSSTRSAGTDRVSWDGSSQTVRCQRGRIESAGTDRVSRYAVSRDGSSQLGRIESADTRSAGTDRISWDGSSQPVRSQPARIESAGTDRVSRYAVSRHGSSQLGRIESAGTRSAGTDRVSWDGSSQPVRGAVRRDRSACPLAKRLPQQPPTAVSIDSAKRFQLVRLLVRRSCTVWHALSSVDTLEKRLAMFVMRRFAVVRRTSTVCSRSDMVAVVRHREQWSL